MSIGELAGRTGVATTALRYYDQLGLVRPASRVGGRRRYAESAISEVGVVLFLREAGFSLAEIGTLTVAERESWTAMIDHKLEELSQQQHQIEVARAALEHGRRCPAGQPMKCLRFSAIIKGHRSGHSLEDGHARAHIDDPGRA